jgi:hypothetical protein
LGISGYIQEKYAKERSISNEHASKEGIQRHVLDESHRTWSDTLGRIVNCFSTRSLSAGSQSKKKVAKGGSPYIIMTNTTSVYLFKRMQYN